MKTRMKAHFFITTVRQDTHLRYNKEVESHDLKTNDLEVAKRRTMGIARKSRYIRRHLKGRPAWRYPNVEQPGFNRGLAATRSYKSEDEYFRYYVTIHITHTKVTHEPLLPENVD